MNNLNEENIVGIAALLVHAAKIDEQYSENEKEIIKEFLKSYTNTSDLEKIIPRVTQLRSQIL